MQKLFVLLEVSLRTGFFLFCLTLCWPLSSCWVPLSSRADQVFRIGCMSETWPTSWNCMINIVLIKIISTVVYSDIWPDVLILYQIIHRAHRIKMLKGTWLCYERNLTSLMTGYLISCYLNDWIMESNWPAMFWYYLVRSLCSTSLPLALHWQLFGKVYQNKIVYLSQRQTS